MINPVIQALVDSEALNMERVEVWSKTPDGSFVCTVYRRAPEHSDCTHLYSSDLKKAVQEHFNNDCQKLLNGRPKR